ncbi:hypothetical protein [Ohtaekwangia sp.]|uniref:hypothetical protein n=1 Tax=Ohtaekwangia sp. TaxID=2066019 RepID=UPI002FDE3054
MIKSEGTSFSELNIALIKLPSSIQTIIFLLKEDIKNQKLFNSLREIGLEDSPYQSDLCSVILPAIGLDSDNDETISLYIALLKKYSAASEPTVTSFTEQAFHLYAELSSFNKQAEYDNHPNG